MHSLLTAEFNAQKAQDILSLTDSEKKEIVRNTAAYDGDFWQQGSGYLGPRPATNDPAAADVYKQIEKLFTSKNVIKEVVKRQTNALLSQRPAIGFDFQTDQPRKKIPDPNFQSNPLIPDQEAPEILEPLTPEQEELVRLASDALSDWFSQRDVILAVKRIFRRRLLGRRSSTRLFVPAKFQSAKAPKTLADALQWIALDEPTAENARVDLDLLTRDEMSVVKVYTSREDKTGQVEIGFVSDAGDTYVGVLKSSGAEIQSGIPLATNTTPDRTLPALPTSFTTDGDPEDDEPTGDQQLAQIKPLFSFLSSPLKLNGQLLVYELKGEPLVTNQVWSLNASLNLALTMADHVLVESGFSELALTNVELETEDIPDPTAPGGKRKAVKPVRRGSGVVNAWVGVEQQGATGETSYATPGVHFKEPTPVDVHVTGVELFYRAILEECHQIHALIAGDATPSGESRRQALADFVSETLDWRSELEAFGRWLTETVLYLAANLMTDDSLLQLNAQFGTRLDVGALSSEEQTALLAQVDKKLRSRKSARALLGIEDNTAEEEQIRREAADASLNPPPPQLDPRNPLNQPPNPANPPKKKPKPKPAR